MGWGVMDYPSAPREGESRCTDGGCEIRFPDSSYECSAKACRHDYLCKDCVFTCADCLQDFCGEHAQDINEANDKYAIYVCQPCLAKRNDNNEQKAA